jgi:hypothetical protein
MTHLGHKNITVSLTKFSWLKRRPDLTPDQYSDHWRTTHVQVLVHQGGHKTYNKRYLQNHFINDSSIGFSSSEFDGAAQMIPQQADVVTRGFQEDPLYQKFVRPDEYKFLDVSSCIVIYCESSPILHDPHAGGVKLLSLMKRLPSMTHAEFMYAWRQRHAPLMQEQFDFWKHVRGYTQHEVLQDATRSMVSGKKANSSMAYDGVAELRFNSLTDLKAALTCDAYRNVIHTDTATFKGEGSHSFLASEELVYDDT